MTRIALLVLCAACSLGGHRPNYQYYVLASGAPAQRAAQAPPPENQRALAITQVTIPGYLDREQIATRTAGNQIEYSRTDRWGEPLDQAFERTLREDLAARLAATGIIVQSRGTAPGYDLSVDVMRFERIGTGHVELQAAWTLRSDDARIIDRGETRLRVAVAGADTNAMATALSDAIARMAAELAPRVERAERTASARR
jgi:uncharacterized lipoprotein YmbA